MLTLFLLLEKNTISYIIGLTWDSFLLGDEKHLVSYFTLNELCGL